MYQIFSRFFKDKDDNEDKLVFKLCFHCGRDGEYREDEDICKYCGMHL